MKLIDFIESIKNGDEKQLELLYKMHRKAFITWVVKSFNVDDELALDAFQEAVVHFYYNSKQGKVVASESSVKTYLFSIGKFVLFNKIRSEKKNMITSLEQEVSEIKIEKDLFEMGEDQEYLQSALKRLGNACRELLKLFYFDNNSMEAIASKMGYKNENVAKTQKMRCLNSLKELIKNKEI